MSLGESMLDNQNSLTIRNKQTIVFDQSKNSLLTVSNELRSFFRRIKLSGYRVIVNKDEIRPEVLNTAFVFIIIAPQGLYKELEFNLLKKYLDRGGKVWVILSEGGEKKLQTNINFLLEQYSISVNNDSVVRTYYYKYSHPKESLINNGLLNRGLLRLIDNINNSSYANGEDAKRIKSTDTNDNQSSSDKESLTFVYPFGSTLNVASPAIALLSTGSNCIPANRPICALNRLTNSNDAGTLLVLGSVHVFADQYINNEQNQLTMEILMQTLLQPQLSINAVDALNPELSEYHSLPDISVLANRPIGCLHESEPLPADISKLILCSSVTRFCTSTYQSAQANPAHQSINSGLLFQFNNQGYLDVLNAYDHLQVDHEPLQLIRPMFESPLPPLRPAVLAPVFRGLHRPVLELFDLESEFSSVSTRLAQLAAQCTDDNIAYFISECGKLFSLPNCNQPKALLEQVFKQIIQFKKVS